MSRGLDIPTLLAAETGSALLSALLLSVSRGVRGAPGARHAAMASWCLAFAFCAQFLRGSVPDALSFIGSNAAMIIGTGFIFESYQRFNDPARRSWRTLLLSTALSLVFAVMWLGGSSYTSRALFMSISLALFLFGGARELMRDGGVGREPSRLIGISLSLLTGAALLVRIGLLLSQPPDAGDYSAPSLERTIAFFPATVMLQGIGLGFLVMLRDRSEAQAVLLATTDALTGCLNRRALEVRLVSELDYARRRGAFLGVVLLDLDHFKSINDQHGHAGGDLVLQHAARSLRGGVRSSDLVARLGGEEFCVILRDADLARAGELAERLRLAIATPAEGVNVTPTASLGVTCFDPARRETWDELFRRGDSALYRAKQGGRNRVELAPPAGALLAAAPAAAQPA